MRQVINDDVKKELPGSGNKEDRNHFFFFFFFRSDLNFTARGHNFNRQYENLSYIHGLLPKLLLLKMIKHRLSTKLLQHKTGKIILINFISNLILKQLRVNRPTK